MISLCHGLRASSLTLCSVLLFACTNSSETRAPARSPAPASAPSASAKSVALPKVVFLGDSISAGLHLPEEEAFPAVLQRVLARRGAPFQLINAGVSGDTTSGGLRRVDWILKQQPSLIVLELGANDGLRGIELKLVEDNLRAIITKIRERNVPVLLLGMRLPTSHGPAYTEGFEALYTRVASDLSVPLVPFFMRGVAGVPSLNLEDGLHPTTAGHELLAANVVDELERLVRALPPVGNTP